MKKLVLLALALVVAVVAAVVVMKRPRGGESAAALAPDEAALFVELPDVHRTRDRWKTTAISEIANEPAVQAFFAKPKSKLPDAGALKKQLDALLACDPHESFLAVTAPGKDDPKVVAGFVFAGEGANADALVAMLKNEAQKTMPAGKADVIKYGDIEIATFAFDKSVLASAIKGTWCFIGNDVDLLKATLDRLDGKTGGKVLRDARSFKDSLARMPRDFEAMIFVQPQTFLARLEPMLNANGNAGSQKQIEELKKIQAFTMTTKIEGAQMHDTIFMLRPDAPKSPALTRGALALTSTDTLIFYDARLQIPKDLDLRRSSALPMASQIGGEWLGWFEKIAKQLAADDGELGVQVDLPAGVMQPGVLVSLQTRDAESAAKLAESIASSPADFGAWKREQLDGGPLYTLKLPGIAALISPVMTVSGKSVLIGLDFDALKKSAERAKTGSGGGLAKSEDFHRAEALVGKPTNAFGYADTRAFFLRIYDTAKPALMLWMMMSPEANKVVDPSKLPPADAIAKHLTPIVCSQAAVENGTLAESVGPVTFGQALIGFVAGATAAGAQMQGQIPHAMPAPRVQHTPAPLVIPPPSPKPAPPASAVPAQ
jgi:hypothetical protein